ncbi:hypothetical protein AB0O39_36440 [Streptomyces anulatus]|uniref:hypothetical protein n=1 Tax=Streptomyces anulatus TaxID=1892 RepID=UPI00344041E2
MTRREDSPTLQELSSDPIRRASQYQTAGTNARLQVFALLKAQGVPANEADDLAAALAAGAVAGAESEVAELAGMAPGSRGAVFEDGWDDAVRAMSEALVGIADRGWSRRSGRSAGAAELTVHIADIQQRERADLERLQAFVRQTVLPHTHPNTMARRRMLEALGEADGLCTARTVNAGGYIIICTLDAGHGNPDVKPPFRDGKPGGRHKTDASIWNDLGAACTPHTAL